MSEFDDNINCEKKVHKTSKRNTFFLICWVIPLLAIGAIGVIFGTILAPFLRGAVAGYEAVNEWMDEK